jgi:hypothetical protein
MPLKSRMLSSTVMPAVVLVGVLGALATKTAMLGQARANPCAAKRACNPCAGRRGCNPCAAKSPCNPCAAGNPCAAAAAKNGSRCVIPRLQKAALCNPCAAKKGCNPCAAKSPCNPCAARSPCNPCAAKAPCNPCGAAADIELTASEAKKAYDCIVTEMRKAYAKSGLEVASAYANWTRYSKGAYQSATHGGRFVQNYANAVAKNYGRFEKAGEMPPGAYLAKDSFTVAAIGTVAAGPLFIMRKMGAGWNPASGDWKYAMVMPNGAFFGETRGKNADNMKFCAECHMSVAKAQDSMFFMPEEYRR